MIGVGDSFESIQQKMHMLLYFIGFTNLSNHNSCQAVEPECLPASIYGYSYYVIQKNGDLVHWGDYASPTYQAA